MITLTVNPAEVPPDFSKEEFSFTRDAVKHGREGMTNQQAAEILLDAWKEAVERRKAIWDAEQEEREAEQRAGRNMQEEPQRSQDEENTLPSNHSRPQSPMSKNEGPNLIVGKPVPEVIEYPPARFAIKKLRECEYIELSYFTPKGRAEAAKNKSVASNDVFTLAKEDDILAWKPIVNFKVKGMTTEDKDLSWEQLCIVSTNFLEHIVQEKWPNNMVDTMHTFFFCLTNHKLQNEGAEGLKVLILYQAWVHKE